MHRSAVGSTAQTGRLRHAGAGAASGERNSGKRALGDRKERGVISWDVGAERLVKTIWHERELVAAVRQLVLDDEGDDPGSRELGLQVGQVLTLVRSKAGDGDETDHVVGRAGGGDDRAAKE